MPFRIRKARPERSPWPELDDATAGWIGTHRRPFHDYAVGSLVPVVFERYARILHPAWSTSGAPVRWATIAQWSGKVVHGLAQFDPLARRANSARGPAPFVREPDTGGLPREQLASLCASLSDHTSSRDRCFIGIWEGYGGIQQAYPLPIGELRLDQRTHLVHVGPLEEVGRDGWRLEDGRLVVESPTLFWPADHAWFVSSDVDLDSTYVGGSQRLIEDLVDLATLEVWPVNATDRVTYDSDEINEV